MSKSNKKIYRLKEGIRDAFPIFSNLENRLAYLDTASSAQKPKIVLDTLRDYFSNEYANVHRGAYRLSAVSSLKYEAVREKVADFICASDLNEIVFTSGATESVNLVANGLEGYFNEGDTVLLSYLEHHSNIVPWQMLAKRKKLNIEFIKVTGDGDLDYKDAEEKIKQFEPRLIAITAQSNLLGTIVDLSRINSFRENLDTLLFVDASQAVAHSNVDVQKINADFLVFSGHKLYAPNGVGVLYGKADLLREMSVYQVGGGMITEVSIEGSSFAEAPWKFEAGTPPISEVIALGAAIDFVSLYGIDKISELENEVFEYALKSLSSLSGVEMYGPYKSKGVQSSIISFNLKGVHPHDLATCADSRNVQIRAGHHCAMPLLKALNLDSTVRMSLGIYSEKEDIDLLVEAIEYSKKVLI